MGGLAHLTEHYFMDCVPATPVYNSSCADPEGGPEHLLDVRLWFWAHLRYNSLIHPCQFVQKNGGDLNAFTRNNWTEYMFYISPTKLHAALPAFASAFASTPKLGDIVHDVLSVTSEFQGYKIDRHKMLAHLNAYIVRPESRSFHHVDAGYESLSESLGTKRGGAFDAGNTDVSESIRQRVLEWWNLKYPTRTKVAVLLGQGMYIIPNIENALIST